MDHVHGHKDRPTRGLRSQVTHARYTPTYNPYTHHTHPHFGFPRPAPHLPWPPPRPFLSSPNGSSPHLGRCGGRRRGAGDTGGCREEVPRAQQAEGARGRAARGRRLPGLKPVAPRARLPLPGSEGRGRAARKGWGSGGNYDDGAGVEPRMRASLLAEFNWFGGIQRLEPG